MISLTQFETLSPDEQAAHTWQCGKYLLGQLSAGSITNLFNVGDFYVEITSDPHLQSVHRVVSFKTTATLDLIYLDGVSLHDLVTDLLPVMQPVKENNHFRESFFS